MNVFKAQGQTLTVETIHPFSSGDPHGLILFFVILAVLISTLVAQALVGLRGDAGFGFRLIMVAIYAVIAALVAMGMATWLAGDYGSGFWVATCMLALASAAVGAVVAGSARLLGAPGVALAGLVVVAVTEFPFPAGGVQAFEEGIIEMTGPGAEHSGCANRATLCLVLTPGAVTARSPGPGHQPRSLPGSGRCAGCRRRRSGRPVRGRPGTAGWPG